MIDKLKGQSGASMVIALLFFLICLAVGGVVVAAASANAGAVSKEKAGQQQAYDVGCAAQALAEQLASSKVTVKETTEGDVKSFAVTKVEGTEMARAFWAKQGKAILANRSQNKSTVLNDLSVAGGSQAVKGTLTVDAQCNMVATLTLDDSKAYAMTVTLQAVPTYDYAGHLKSIEYEAPVIQKTADAAQAGGRS